MRRRELVLSAASMFLPWAVGADALEPRVRAGALALGVLMGSSATDKNTGQRLEALLQQLGELGWMAERNLNLDIRYAEGDSAEMSRLARALMTGRPKVILAHTTPATIAVQEVAGATPVVFVTVTDPVRSGFVENLVRPGGNATGLVNMEASLAGKWVELLHEVAPHVTRVAMLYNPVTAPFADYYLTPFASAAASLGLQSLNIPLTSPTDIEAALARLTATADGGAMLMPDVFNSMNRASIIALAEKFRLPIVYPYGYMCREGGLIAYGIDETDLFRRAAYYVDKLLRGAKPGDMPVQAPTNFEFVINLKAASAIGLTIPENVVQRADEVIE